jgi:hypothetical protein
MRRAAKVDANQPETIRYLRQIGWSVEPTHQLGKGFPDFIAGRHGFACLVELKDGDKVPSARELTDDQVKFSDRWKGPYVVCVSPEDCAARLDDEYRGSCALLSLLNEPYGDGIL